MVGGETGGIVGVGVDDCVGAGVDVGVEVGDALPPAAEVVGDATAFGEISFRGDGVGLGVGDFDTFSGVAVTVGDLRGAARDGFVFAVVVGVGLGVAVCALRSTPRREPRPTATSVLPAVAEGLTRGLKEERNDRFGVGVGVGVGAALSANATPSTNADVGKTNLRFMQLRNSNS